MKKIAILALGLVAAGSVANAQTTSTTSTVGSTKWGLKAGVNLSKYSYGADDTDNPTTDNNTNFHVTGYLDLPLGGRFFSVQPGLSLQGKGAESETTFDNVKQSTMWIEVPVNLVGKVPLGATGTSLYLGAGPYAAYGIAGEQKTTIKATNTETTNDLHFGNESGDDIKAFDAGINFLGGIQLNNGFNVGAGYGLGLTDLRPSGSGGNGQVTHRVWSFSLGYAF